MKVFELDVLELEHLSTEELLNLCSRAGVGIRHASRAEIIERLKSASLI